MLKITFNNTEFIIGSDGSGLSAIADPVYNQAARLMMWSMTKWIQINPDSTLRVYFVKDITQAPKSYQVTCTGENSYEIRWNSLPAPREDIHYNFAAFASAALCEKIHGAVMIMPGITGLHVNINTPGIMNQGESFFYQSNFKFLCWSNINVRSDEQCFFHWHHIPSEGINNTGLRGRYLDQFAPYLPNIGHPFEVKAYTFYLPGPGNSGADPFAPITLYCETFKIGGILYEDSILNRYVIPSAGILYLKGPLDLFYPVSISQKGAIISFPSIVPDNTSELPAGTFPYNTITSYRCLSPHSSYADNWANRFPIMVDQPQPPAEVNYPTSQKLDIFRNYQDPENENIVAEHLFNQWITQGRPDTVNMFEQDGIDYRHIIPLFLADMPAKYKAVEINGVMYNLTEDPEFLAVISRSVRIGAPSGINFPWTDNPHKNKWWLENFYEIFEIQNHICPNPRDYKFWLNMGSVTNDTSWQTNKIVLTRYYLKWFKIVEDLFIRRCTNLGYAMPQFRVLAYSNYYSFPKDYNIDLSRFEVWFTTPAISHKSQGRFSLDIANWDRWRATGATMIWRPNIFYTWRTLPFLDYFHWAPLLRHILPSMQGMFVDGYTPENGSGLQAMNIYALARGLRGVDRKVILNEFSTCFGPGKEAVNTFVQAMIQASYEIIPYPQGKRANMMPLNRELHGHLTSGLRASGVNLTSPTTYSDKYLSFCMYLWQKFLDYQDELSIEKRAEIKSEILLWIRDFLKNNPDCQCFSPFLGNTTRLLGAYGDTRQLPNGTWQEDGLTTYGFNVPVNTLPPSLTFQSKSAGVLSISPGNWKSRDTVQFEYQWRRNGLNIRQANQSTYTIQSEDVGTTIDCFVRAINKWGDYYWESNGYFVSQSDLNKVKSVPFSGIGHSIIKTIGKVFRR